ncbi:DUF397 domain-containing protein [Streptomyces sp. NPDC018833]|uniref:DUF397 domain-containing protein n=1 Tax=Streptomyces sp. NPDC018833 TaxID=3365053 RepID=UPI0037A984A9
MISRSSSGPSQAGFVRTAGERALDWKRSSFCGGGGNCVEVAVSADRIAIRDSVFPRQTIKVDRHAFAIFATHLPDGSDSAGPLR